jgi:hypothetical protein
MRKYLKPTKRYFYLQIFRVLFAHYVHHENHEAFLHLTSLQLKKELWKKTENKTKLAQKSKLARRALKDDQILRLKTDSFLQISIII